MQCSVLETGTRFSELSRQGESTGFYVIIFNGKQFGKSICSRLPTSEGSLVQGYQCLYLWHCWAMSQAEGMQPASSSRIFFR